MEPKEIIEKLIEKIKNDERYSNKITGIITFIKDGEKTKLTLEEYLRAEFIKVVKAGSDVEKLFSLIEAKALPNTRVTNVIKNEENAKENYINNFIQEKQITNTEFIQYIKNTASKYMDNNYIVRMAGKEYSLEELYNLFIKNKEETELLNNEESLNNSIKETVEYYIDAYYEKEISEVELSSGITYREYLIKDLTEKAISQTEVKIGNDIFAIDEYIEKLYINDLELIARDLEQPSLMSPLIMTNGEYSTEELQKLSNKEGSALINSLNSKTKMVSNDSVYMYAKDAIYNSKESETIDNVLNNMEGIVGIEKMPNLNELSDQKKMHLTKIKMNQDELLVSIDERMDKLTGILNRELTIENKNYVEKSIEDLENSIGMLTSIPKDITDNLIALKEQYKMKSCAKRVVDFGEKKLKNDFLTGIEFEIATVVNPLKLSISGEVNSVNTGLKVKLDNIIKNIYDKLQFAKEQGTITSEEYNNYCEKIENLFENSKNKKRGA